MSGLFKLNGVDYMGGGGGGGNANDMELTYDEYEELSEAEKTNGTNYFITDIDNFDNNTNFRPVIYSTREREIGVWTDGKPIYQKTIVYDTPFNITNDAWYTSSESYPDIELIANAWVINSAGAIYNGIIVVIENEKLVIGNQTKTQPINNLKYVILQYTKSTDQPGSGTWSPQGIPAIHCSTEEQAVGTWINGKTIYEKTWSFDNPTKQYAQNTYYYTPSMNLSGVEAIIDWRCSVYDTTDGRTYTLPYYRIISNEDIKCECLIINNTCDLSTQVFFSSSQAYNLTNITWTIRYVKKS